MAPASGSRSSGVQEAPPREHERYGLEAVAQAVLVARILVVDRLRHRVALLPAERAEPSQHPAETAPVPEPPPKRWCAHAEPSCADLAVRFLLELARRGITGAYALGTGNKRKIWVFRISELAASVARNETPIPNPQKPCTIESGSPR